MFFKLSHKKDISQNDAVRLACSDERNGIIIWYCIEYLGILLPLLPSSHRRPARRRATFSEISCFFLLSVSMYVNTSIMTPLDRMS